MDVDIPPLRERRQDIPDLVGFFIHMANPQYGVNIRDVSQPAMKALIDYDWPGNIRELKYVIEKAMIFCDSDVIDISHLPADLTKIEV